jgi:hypothetical protein
MNPDNTFSGAYLKVARANYHINTLIDLTQPLASNFYEIGWRAATNLPCVIEFSGGGADPDVVVRELAYIPKQRISQHLALVIGDAVHNMRAALDYAATAVVRSTGGNAKYVYFPFHKVRENLVASSMRDIQTALPNADVEAFFRDVIKSYKGGAEGLWELTKIDKIEKHNFILPHVAIVGIRHVGTVVTCGGNTLSLNGVRGNADAQQVLYRMPISDVDMRKYDVNLSVEVLFPEGEFFGRLPVIPTLVKLSQTVKQALCTFEDFAVAAGAPVRSRA